MLASRADANEVAVSSAAHASSEKSVGTRSLLISMASSSKLLKHVACQYANTRSASSRRCGETCPVRVASDPGLWASNAG